MGSNGDRREILEEKLLGKGLSIEKLPRAIREPILRVVRWGRRHSLWIVALPLGCCGIEWIVASTSRLDLDRFGILTFDSPRWCDVLLVAGWVSRKMLPVLLRIYEQMPEPKYVILYGECAISGGPFYDGYGIVNNLPEILPVDLYVPGCPPRPSALVYALLKLKEKIAERGSIEGFEGERRSVNWDLARKVAKGEE